MVETASSLRLLISARGDDYRANLQFCCDHHHSVSEVCRRLKVNRQQFNRYLTGAAVPSRHNHRRIGDFFGLEEHELLMPREAFAQRAAERRPLAALDRHAALLRDASQSGSRDLHEYVGFYLEYFYSYLGNGRIKRELAHWRYDGDTLVLPGEAALHRGGRGLRSLAAFHDLPRARRDLRRPPDNHRRPAGRGALGTFDADDPSVPEPVRHAIGNEIRPDETLFLARP